MTCDRLESLVDDYVDGTLADDERRHVEAHLVDCDRCRMLADDLAAIKRTAGSLEPHVPSPQVWARIAASVEAERQRGWWRLTGQPLRGAFAWKPAAIAATVLVATIGTSWLVLREGERAVPAQQPQQAATEPANRGSATPADTELVQSVETELKLAEEHYQKAIAGLEQITRTESAALDPQVAAVLQKNLDVIDHAIGESRAALQSQPTSEVAQESLFDALRNKVALLQDTVVLINEMRKGNPEGTARVVSGLNQ